MKKLLFLIVLSIIFGQQISFAKSVMYVTLSGSGDTSGTSWQNAFPRDSLQSAINTLAKEGGGQVWVAAGTYYPTQDTTGNRNPQNVRNKTFTLKNGVQLYGGFMGTETSINERQHRDIDGDNIISGWEMKNETILSGEIQKDGDTSNNVYHVTFQKSSSVSDILVDGFKITLGNASDDNNQSSNIERNNGGGGFVFYTQIKNCSFVGNKANYSGGGIYLHFANIDSSLISYNSCGYEDYMNLGGGVMLNEVGTIRNSFITNNKGIRGAGAFLNAGGSLVSCIIKNNQSRTHYSQPSNCVAVYRGGSIINSLIVENVGNVATFKGSIVSCTILNNTDINTNEYMSQANYYTLYQSDMINCLYGDRLLEALSTVKYSTTTKKMADTLTNSVVDSAKRLFLDDHYVITTKTPGFNAGSPDISNLNIPEYDLNGNQRIAYNRIDRGAYEFLSRRYVTINGNGGKNGSSWENAYPKENLKDAINSGYGEVWIAAGQYVVDFDMNLPEGVYLYGGFKGDEKQINERKRSDIDINNKIEAWEFTNTTSIKKEGYYSVIENSKQASIDGLSFSGLKNSSAVNFSNGKIENCIFTDNDCSNSCVRLTDSAEIRNCLIERNSTSGSGGGISLSGKSRAIACVIRSNKTTYLHNSQGGGVMLSDNALLAESIVCNNFNSGRADENGGGIHATAGTIRNCIITNNTSDGDGTRGGGVFVADNSNTQIINSIICNNKVTGYDANGNDLAIAVRAQVVNTIIGSPLFTRGISTSNRMKYCAMPTMVTDYGIDSIFVYKGSDDLYAQFVRPTSFIGVAQTETEKFALSRADWHLKSTSWFINKGLSDNSLLTLPELDADQTARVKYNKIDLGAYEIKIRKPLNIWRLDSLRSFWKGNSYCVDFSWTKDSADRYLLFLKEGVSGRVQPTDGETYVGDTVFGKGTNCNGWYCAYNGTNTSATISGLLKGTDYKAMVITQNGLKQTVFNADIVNNILSFTTKRMQTISFKLPDTLFAGKQYMLNAVSSSGLDVDVRVDNKDYVSIGAQTAWINKADDLTKTVRFVAYQKGNSQYEAADSVVIYAMIAKSNQTITFPSLPTKQFGDPNFAPLATSNSGLEVEYVSSNNNVAIINNNQIQIIGVGKTIITATQKGNTVYDKAQAVSQTLSVNSAEQTISFPMLSDKMYGDADFAAAVSASSHLNPTLTSSDTSVAKIINNQIRIVGVGNTTIYATQEGNQFYFAADTVAQKLVVKKAKQIISFAPISNKTYNDDDFVPNVSISSNQDITLESSNTSVALIEKGTIRIIGAGSVTITASQKGNELFEEATSVSQSFTVRKAQQFIIAENQLTVEYGSKPFVINANSTSGKPLTFTINGTALGMKEDSITVNSAGVASVIISLGGDNNYLPAAPKTVFVTIISKSQTISLEPFEHAIAYTDTLLDPKSFSSEQLTVSLTSSDLSVAQIVNDTLIKIIGVGSCNITPVQTGTISVSSAVGQAQKLVIVPAAQKINKLPSAIQTKVGAEAIVLNAVALQNCRVNYELISGTSVELVENKIYVLEPGVSKVIARVAGYKNYRDTTDTCTIIVSALNTLRMPSYTITRDTVINLRDLVLTNDTLLFSYINDASAQVSATILDSMASISINPSKKSWIGIDTIWFKAQNKNVEADSLLIAIKVRRKPLAEQIGIVTVDSATGKHCIIVWERSQNAGISGYIIYRGGTSAKWDSIGYVSANEPGLFIDSAESINVNKQAYQYRMVTVYPDNVHSEPSAAHTTMHLQTGRNLDNIPQLLWTPYRGAEVSMYIIYRQDTKTHKLDSIGSSILTSFTDIDAPDQTARYRVAIRFANGINPRKEKSDSGPFSQSLSNMSEASLVSLDSSEQNDVVAYPNPASNNLSIITNEVIEHIAFIAADGHIAKQIQKVDITAANINVTDLARGLYSTQVTTANGVKTITLTLQ